MHDKMMAEFLASNMNWIVEYGQRPTEDTVGWFVSCCIAEIGDLREERNADLHTIAKMDARMRDLESRIPHDFQQALEDEFEKGRQEGYAERETEEEGLG